MDDTPIAYRTQSLGHAESAISREGAYLQDVFGAYHGDQHLEQAPLDMAAHHASVECVQVGGPPKAVQIVALGVAVLFYISLQLFSHDRLDWGWWVKQSSASTPRR